MILSRLSHLQKFMGCCQVSKINGLILSGNKYWLGNDKGFKSQPYKQKLHKPQILSSSIEDVSDKKLFKKSTSSTQTSTTPVQESTNKRLFKKSSTTTKSNTVKQEQQKIPSEKTQIYTNPQSVQTQSKPSSQTSLTPQQQAQLSSYRLRTCQLTLDDYKDKMKQSTDVESAISLFRRFQTKLREKQIDKTQLKDKYKSIMYASVMRALSRILRRETFLERAKLFGFIGQDYQSVAELQLSCLTTLELSDFIALFFLFEAVYKYRTMSPAKIKVVERYLHQIYNRYTLNSSKKGLQKSDYSKRQFLMTEEKQEKRFLSELIVVTKTAQMFHSPLFDKFLDIVMENLNQKQLHPYKITSFVRFLLKPQSLTSINKQLQILNILLTKMHSTGIHKDFDYSVLKEFYINLTALVENNHLLLDMSLAKDMITKIDDFVISLLPKIVTEEIYQFALFSLKRDFIGAERLGKCILQYVFTQIRLNGETSLNPLNVIYLVSTNVDQNVKFTQIDPEWQQKFINMYNIYLLDTKPCPNLSFCEPQLTKIVNNIQSKKIRQTIMQSYISPTKTCIIPYNQQSFLLENHYLQQKDKPKMFASLYRLYQMLPSSEKGKGFLRNIFDELEKSHISEEMKKDLYKNDKNYIEGVYPLKTNRGWYVKTLSRYCFELGHEELVYSLFAQHLTLIIDYNADLKKKYSRNSGPISKETSNKTYLPQTMDQKCRDKINALFLNFIYMSFELDLKLVKKQKNVKLEDKIQTNQFINLIKSQEVFVDMFLQVLAMRDTATAIGYHGTKDRVEFLLRVLKFLTVGTLNTSKISKKDVNHQGLEKYYYAYYQILKNYSIQKLKKLTFSPLFEQAVQKMLYPKQKSKLSDKQPKTHNQTNVNTSQAPFTYDKSTGQIFVNEQHAKILRNRYEKCLELQQTQAKSSKLA